MILNFLSFSRLNEGYSNHSNPEKIYLMDKIQLHTQEEYLSNSFLVEEDKKKMKDLFVGDLDAIMEKRSWNEYESSLKSYVKTKAYNKLVEMMYGKGYKNPESDATQIVVGVDTSSMAATMKYGSNPKNIKMTRGQYFSKVWSRVDEYCDNSVEFLIKGTIKDTLGDATEYSKNILLVILAAVIIYFGAKAIGIGAGVAGASTLVASSSGLSAIRNIIFNAGIKSLSVVEKYAVKIQNILSNPKTWTGIIGWEIWDSAPKLLSMINSDDRNELLKSDEEDMIAKLSSDNKKKQISKIKFALEQHSDFTTKPFFDGPVQVWQSGIKQMPGWEAWAKKEGYTDTPERLGYVFTYYVALYSYQFQLYIWKYNYLTMLKKGKSLAIQQK
jgi:hypothetical protein